MNDTKIGNVVTLVAPSGRTRDVVVTDVFRDIFDRKTVIAIEFDGIDGPTTLPIKFFRKSTQGAS